jgi:hypothetical protein
MQLIMAAGESPAQGLQVLDTLQTIFNKGTLPAASRQSTVAQILKLRCSPGS